MECHYLTLIILVLLFTSIVSAMAGEGVDDLHRDSDMIIDDVLGYGSEAFTYIFPPLEPIAEALFARAVGRAPDSPRRSDSGNIQPGPVTARRQPIFRYPSPSLASQPTPPYPLLAATASTTTLSAGNGDTVINRPPDANIHAVQQSQYRIAEVDVFFTQQWIVDSHTTGERVVPSRQSATHLRRLWPQQYPQDQLRRPEQTIQLQARTHVTEQTQGTRGEPFAISNPLSCDVPDCTYVATKSDDLRHHQRIHIPNEDRRHPCPHCHQRFLYPREVRRHLPTHNLGPRHYCPYWQCLFAIQGFGRRDHLIRHIRIKHAADSVQQGSATTFES